MQTSRVGGEDRLTVPAAMRREPGINPGGRVRFVRSGRGVLIEAVKEPAVDSLFGVLTVPKRHRGGRFDAAIEAARVRAPSRRS